MKLRGALEGTGQVCVLTMRGVCVVGGGGCASEGALCRCGRSYLWRSRHWFAGGGGGLCSVFSPSPCTGSIQPRRRLCTRCTCFPVSVWRGEGVHRRSGTRGSCTTTTWGMYSEWGQCPPGKFPVARHLRAGACQRLWLHSQVMVAVMTTPLYNDSDCGCFKDNSKASSVALGIPQVEPTTILDSHTFASVVLSHCRRAGFPHPTC